jgi:hypothetical protein
MWPCGAAWLQAEQASHDRVEQALRDHLQHASEATTALQDAQRMACESQLSAEAAASELRDAQRELQVWRLSGGEGGRGGEALC